MKWLLLAAAVCAVIWFFNRSRKRTAPMPSEKLAAPEVPTQEIALEVPNLPAELETKIVRTLASGGNPDEIELPGSYHAHHMGVAGESFNNPNGTSRQAIIETAEPGDIVYLVPEPNNDHDAQAVRVFVSKGGKATAQIGYLPRGHGLTEEIERGHVSAWFAHRRRSDTGSWGAAIFVLRTEP